MEFFKNLFGKNKSKKCGGCKVVSRETVEEFVSQLKKLKEKHNDLELDHIELGNVNAALKEKNEKLIDVLLKVSNISMLAVECAKKGF